jgi:glycosyltransferase involved in cell wall biosynthesis
MTNHQPSITAIILTYNEEQHISRCIESLLPVVSRICIIDSHSKDRTVEIAQRLGASVLQNPWKNYATQFQWGLDHAGIQDEWTMRIDADEYLEPALQQSIRDFVKAPGNHNAAYFRRKMVFMGQPITHGFFYPAMMLRLWKTGEGHIEQRWMDEHVVVNNANTTALAGDLVDENLNDLAWWTQKHVGYATREVYDIIASREKSRQHPSVDDLSGQAKRKRFLKEQVYAKLPTSIRSTCYFFFRYILGRGFLDGKAGFFFHFLQAYWYRTLVDAKLFELEAAARKQNTTPYELLKRQGIWNQG